MDQRLQMMEIFIGEEFALFPEKPIMDYIRRLKKNNVDLGDGGISIFVPTVYDVLVTNIPNASVTLHIVTDWAIDYVEGIVIYWNPIIPIKIVGRKGTVVFSIALTEEIALKEPRCWNQRQITKGIPVLVEWASQRKPKTIQIPFTSAGIGDLYNYNSYKFCLLVNNSLAVNSLGILRALTILGSRNIYIDYSICASDDKMGKIMMWLKEDKMRKMTILGMKSIVGDISIDMRFFSKIQQIRKIIGVNTSITSLLQRFKPLIGKYMQVIYLVSLMSISDIGLDVKRLQCRGDTYSITTDGVVPINSLLKNLNNKIWLRPSLETNDYIRSVPSYPNRQRQRGVVNYFF